MEKRALVVVRKYGDAEIADSIERGIVHRGNYADLEALRRELRIAKARNAFQGVHANAMRKNWRRLLNELPAKYGYLDERPVYNPVTSGLLIGWAVTWLFMVACYRRFTERFMGRTCDYDI